MEIRAFEPVIMTEMGGINGVETTAGEVVEVENAHPVSAVVSYFEQHTHEIGRFAYARVGVGMRVVTHDDLVEVVRDALAHVCKALVRRESASITGVEHPESVITLDVPHTRAYIKVVYGFTVPVGQRDSVKFDIEVDRPVKKGESLDNAYGRVAAEVSATAKARLASIKNQE